MIVFLLLATAVSWLRADAKPISPGPLTAPTVAHIIFGMSARSGCSDVRSMYDILRSCLFTIAACVYRAVHPNIANSKLSFWGRLRVTLKIVIYALIAPELIILWALRQRFGAHLVGERVNRAMATKVGKLKPEMKWTQTHGQFLQMGGFARKDNGEVLDSWDLVILLCEDRIDFEDLQLTVKEINDKSKGDILSKGLVAFQTTWFIFECIARLRQGLPLIELEVVTLAFATLNAITYGLWWYKPLNVLCPIYIHVRERQQTQAQEVVQVVQDDVATHGSEQEALMEGEAAEVQMGLMAKGKANLLALMRAVEETVQTTIASFAGMLENVKKDVKQQGWWLTTARWLLIKPFMVVVKPLIELSSNHDSGAVSDIWPIDEDTPYCMTHVPTFYAEHLDNNEFLLIIPLTAFIGMIFGAIHFISWHSAFHTHGQLLLWRISCVILVVQPLLMIGEFLVVFGLFSRLNKVTRNIVTKVSISVFSLGILFYIVARFSVVVLAFLTLRDIPLRAFTDISWTSYIPHF